MTAGRWIVLQKSNRVNCGRPKLLLVPPFPYRPLTPLNFDAAYTYDSGGEGKIASVAYPAGGPTYSYQFDSLYRLSGMTDQNSNTDVSGVAYNPANQLTSITYFGIAESRSYTTV